MSAAAPAVYLDTHAMTGYPDNVAGVSYRAKLRVGRICACG